MHLVYVDEIKFQPPGQAYYWLGGLAVPEHRVRSVEDALQALASSYFGTSALDVSAEFHASQIVHGKAQFAGHEVGRRIALFQRLADLIDQNQDIGRVVVRVDPATTTRQDFQRIAFMFMVERVEQLMIARNSLALLIVDHDRDFVTTNVRSLAAYKTTGTEFEFGQDITRVVDTVHHTKSHHSRFLQLADLYVYSLAMRANRPDRPPKRDLVKYIEQLSNFVFPTKYKYWPPEA